LGQFVTMVLATLCTRLGPHDLAKLKFTERQVLISQMWMGDIFYAYMWLRVQNIGNILNLEIQCPFCKTRFPFEADLETTEVVTAASMDVASWDQPLRHPITIRGDKVDGFRMGPSRWATMEAIGDAGADTGTAKSGLIAGSVCGVLGKDGQMAVSESELEELVKYDIEVLSSEIEEHNLGPNMAVDAKCSRCKRESTHPMTWGYDNFFAVSSPSAQKKS
jgi:hypothetical protein